MTSGHPNPFVRQWPHLPWPPPSENDDISRAIPKQVWALNDVHGIANAQLANETGNLLVPITDRCNADVQKLEFSACDLAERVLQLTPKHYDKSMWCKRSKKEGVIVPDEQLWLPCDAYQLRVREVAITGWEG